MSVENIINFLGSDSSFSDKIKQIAFLTKSQMEKIMKIASESYYNKGISLMGDNIFDLIKEKLSAKYPNSKILNEIGTDPNQDYKTKLPYWMGSMNKIKSDDKNLEKWISKYDGPYILSDKLDGISALLVNTKKETKLYTRGDGTYGTDITRFLGHINLDLEDLPECTIRGELIISKKKFKKYEDQNMAQARSTVQGILSRKTIDKKSAKDIDFVGYEVVVPNMKMSEQLNFIKSTNLNYVNYSTVKKLNSSILENYYDDRRKNSPYDIDGIIVTDNNLYKRNTKSNPDYAFAFKGPTDTLITKVNEIKWNISKDGAMFPVAYYEPVKLSGATLQKASAHNAKFVESSKLGPGAEILLVRSGTVIPYILDVTKQSKISGLPQDIDYVWPENSADIYIKDIESNDDVKIKRLEKFCRNLKMENVAIGTIRKLYYAGFDTVLKLINLVPEDIVEIDGLGNKSAIKIYNSIKEGLSNVTLLDLMDASNSFGRGFARNKLSKLLDEIPNILDLYNKMSKKELIGKLVEIEGFKEKTATGFYTGIPKFLKFYDKIKDKIKLKKSAKKTKKLEGYTFLFTGWRDESLKQLILQNGGKVSSGISSKIDYVFYRGELRDKIKKINNPNLKLIDADKAEKTIKNLLNKN